MAMKGQFKVGRRYLVRQWTSVVERTVVEVSPSGELVKFEPGGWEYIRDWYVVEDLGGNPNQKVTSK